MEEEMMLSDIAPGTPVYGVDGELLGPVEAVDEGHSLRVLEHHVPPAAITRVDDDGVHLQLAKAAFTAAPPLTRNDAADARL